MMNTLSGMQKRFFKNNAIIAGVSAAMLMVILVLTLRFTLQRDFLPRYINLFRFMIEKYDDSGGKPDYSYAFMANGGNESPNGDFIVFDSAERVIYRYGENAKSDGDETLLLRNIVGTGLKRGEVRDKVSFIDEVFRGRMLFLMRAEEGKPDLYYLFDYNVGRGFVGVLAILTTVCVIFGISVMAFFLYSNRFILDILARIKNIAEFLAVSIKTGPKQRLKDDEGDELAQISLNINKLFDRVQQKVAQITAFTGNAAHQLRNPLFGIRANAEFVADFCDNVDAAKKHAAIILNDSIRMQEIFDRLLLLSRLDNAEPGSIARGPRFAPKTIAENEKKLLEEQYRLKNVIFKIQDADNCELDVDKELFVQIAHNLMENAAKYAPDTSVIDVIILKAGQGVTFSVANSGAIAAVDRDNIFERFYRGEKGHNKQPGSGLGLAIVKDIAICLGGSVKLVCDDEKQLVEFIADLPTTQG